MSGDEAARNVVKLIRCVISNEDKIELARITLAKDAKFSCRQSFRRIDKANRGYLQESDLREFLRLSGIFPTENEIERYYSQKKIFTSNISYDEFVNQILPKSNLDMKERCLQNDSLEKFFELDASETRKINKLVAAIFEREYKFMKELDFILKELRLDHFENGVHQHLYDVNKEEVTFLRIKEFMERNYSHLEKSEFDALLRRIDRTGFGKLSLLDFLSFFYPFVQSREKYNKLNQNQPIISESLNNRNSSTYKNAYENYDRKNQRDSRMNSRHQFNQASLYAPDMVLLSSCKGYQGGYKGQSRPLSSRGLNEHKSVSMKRIFNDNLINSEYNWRSNQNPKHSLYSARKEHAKNLSSVENHKRLSNYHNKIEYDSNLIDQPQYSEQRRLPQVESKIDEIEDLKNPLKYKNPNCFYRKYYSDVPRMDSSQYY